MDNRYFSLLLFCLLSLSSKSIAQVYYADFDSDRFKPYQSDASMPDYANLDCDSNFGVGYDNQLFKNVRLNEATCQFYVFESTDFIALHNSLEVVEFCIDMNGSIYFLAQHNGKQREFVLKDHALLRIQNAEQSVVFIFQPNKPVRNESGCDLESDIRFSDSLSSSIQFHCSNTLQVIKSYELVLLDQGKSIRYSRVD